MTISRTIILSDGDIIREHLSVGRDEKLDIVYVILPEVNAELSLTVDLTAEGSEANVSGIYLCSSSERVKISIDMLHNKPHCTSHQLFKGLVGGKAQVDFYGKITVAQDAQRTEAYQENHNILLSDDAKVNTKPQLEIYADDVKCSHGATIGRLNEDEQFYMRSRGIPEDEARALQMISFLNPVIEGIADDAQRSAVMQSVETAVKQPLKL